MHADLVGAPGWYVHFHQRGQRAEELHRLEDADRVLSGGSHAHMTLAMLAIVGRQRRIDALRAQLPAPRHQRKVGLVHSAVAYQRMQRCQRTAIARYGETSAGISIQTMDELEGFTRPRGA